MTRVTAVNWRCKLLGKGTGEATTLPNRSIRTSTAPTTKSVIQR